MNWADLMKENADLAPNEILATEATSTSPSTSWDPHEVWLSRVKLPRDCAASTSRVDDVRLARKA